MDTNNNIKSALNLEKMVFEKIEFLRLGFMSNEELKLKFQTNISNESTDNIFKVTLTVKGNKAKEYLFEVSLSGYFSFSAEEILPKSTINDIVSKNTVAILMPFIRSEISLLTAQPETECVVLPPFNINKMFEQEKQ